MKLKGIKVRFEVLKRAEKSSARRLSKGYSTVNPTKRKFTDRVDIHSVINRRTSTSGQKLHEPRKSDISKERRLVLLIRLGKIKPLGEAMNAAYGHLYEIDRKK